MRCALYQRLSGRASDLLERRSLRAFDEALLHGLVHGLVAHHRLAKPPCHGVCRTLQDGAASDVADAGAEEELGHESEGLGRRRSRSVCASQVFGAANLLVGLCECQVIGSEELRLFARREDAVKVALLKVSTLGFLRLLHFLAYAIEVEVACYLRDASRPKVAVGEGVLRAGPVVVQVLREAILPFLELAGRGEQLCRIALQLRSAFPVAAFLCRCGTLSPGQVLVSEGHRLVASILASLRDDGVVIVCGIQGITLLLEALIFLFMLDDIFLRVGEVGIMGLLRSRLAQLRLILANGVSMLLVKGVGSGFRLLHLRPPVAV